MGKYYLIITGFIVLSYVNLSGQDENKIRLLSHPNWEKISKKQPKDQKRWQDFELFASMYARYAIPEEKVLPIVFNILQIENSIKVNEGTIINQLEIINEAFSGKMRNNSSRDYGDIQAQDTKIRFCLGDPGENTFGINFKTIENPISLEDLHKVYDKNIGIEGANRDEYINVWITELSDDMGGFAIMPNQDTLSDGIYIDPDFFGKKTESENYSVGKTLVHLIGQYLSLKPLWTGNDCTDDGVEDTPVHNAPNYACYEYSHISTCSENSEEMIGNFMDATPDACSFMFTKGQVARMHACLSDKGYRKGLLKGITKCANDNSSEILTEQRKEEIFDFEIIPNPTNDLVEIRYYLSEIVGNINVDIIDLSGKVFISQNETIINKEGGLIKFNISFLPSGQYVVKLTSGQLGLTKQMIKL